MPISISDDARKHAIASIKRYFADDLDQDIGELKAGLVLEFILKEIAPTVYNSAIGDAQAFLQDRLADMEGVCSVPEFAYWSTSAVRRGLR